MKKLFVACTVLLFVNAANAQEAAASAAPKKDLNATKQATEQPGTETSKEVKAQLKKLKEQNLSASFTEAGLSDEQIKQAKEVIDASKEQSNKLKEDKSLTDEQKKAKKDGINEEKNAKLREVMKDKFKTWNEIRKGQKAKEEELSSKITD